MTENVLKAMFFLILFATLMLKLLFSDHRFEQAERDSKLGGTRQERAEGGRDIGKENGGLRIAPAGARSTAR
jgi:hypothetical protein